MITLEQAFEATLSRARALPAESLPLRAAAGRFLAEELVAASDSPRFDNSAVDGYAVRTADTGEGRALRVVGTVAAGKPWAEPLPEGCALKIMTGAPLPAAADAVVMLEEVRTEGAGILLARPLKPGECVRRRGEEFRAGASLLPAGTRVTAPVVALLASLGRTHVEVRRAPRVAIVTTGTEVVVPGEPLGPGQIYDANLEGLLAALRPMGIDPVLVRRCPDDADTLRGHLRDAFREAELVVTTGGVSMGDFDHVRDVAASLGLQPVFWKIAVKPGKPTLFGTWPRAGGADGLFFGLSGNPVGALLSFQQLVRPVLKRMMGGEPTVGPTLRARTNAPLEKAAGRLELVRARLAWSEGGPEVAPLPSRESHMLLGLARADCLIHLPKDVERAAQGALVAVEELRWT